MANFYWKVESKIPDVIETGICAVLPIEGYGFFLTGATKRISLKLGSLRYQEMEINQPRNDVYQNFANLDKKGYSQISGFWGFLKIPKSMAGQTVKLQMMAVDEKGREFNTILGSYCIVEHETAETVRIKEKAGSRPLVAICMATYNPDFTSFKRQIHSIIDQSYSNWICIINDDGSKPKNIKFIKKICDADDRFYFFENHTNLGFYKNFEMALRRVPKNADFVAMADQDDDWYPQKIECCIDKFTSDTQLVYSDMRIVTDDGEVLSDTYWVKRKNNYRDMEVILLANTVTGAASMFRRNLLDKIIPFPEKIGDAFHDNWIALSALMVGKIEYIDKPLYDYIQYRGHVIGHCDFDSLTVKGRFMRLRGYLSAYTRVFGKKIIQTDLDFKSFKRNLLIIKDYFIGEGRKNYRLLKAVYKHEYRRLQLFSETLRARTIPKTKAQRFALSLFTGSDASVSKLAHAHYKIGRKHHTTNDAEIRMLCSYVANDISKKSAAWLRKRNINRNFRQIRNREIEIQHTIQFLTQKIEPLKIISDASVPTQINILIPTVDMNLLFGGYIGKLNLARRFIDCGYNVRIIIVDECDFVPIGLDGTLPSASPLSAEFSKIKFHYCFDRDHQVVMNPNDILVASTWWTAHIANAALSYLRAENFIYFIQEYEPFTFPMGAYSAMANESYGFPHFPLFSSKLLKEYFELYKIGIYNEKVDRNPKKTAVFENAIARFKVSADKLSKREYKRVLFYARPDAHASRNMFEMGMLVLKFAVERELFDDTWEFWAAGTIHGEIPLGNGKRLRMIGKLSLDDYQKTLTEFDMGVSLMYTPHPSLVPIEMAAAGMIVVTTNCLNKTAEKMNEISTNIIGVDATLEGIVNGLLQGKEKIKDFEGRMKGADVNWPKSWEESLPTELIHQMIRWFD